jgi:hypothetical protein
MILALGKGRAERSGMEFPAPGSRADVTLPDIT